MSVNNLLESLYQSDEEEKEQKVERVPQHENQIAFNKVSKVQTKTKQKVLRESELNLPIVETGEFTVDQNPTQNSFSRTSISQITTKITPTEKIRSYSSSANVEVVIDAKLKENNPLAIQGQALRDFKDESENFLTEYTTLKAEFVNSIASKFQSRFFEKLQKISRENINGSAEDLKTLLELEANKLLTVLKAFTQFLLTKWEEKKVEANILDIEKYFERLFQIERFNEIIYSLTKQEKVNLSKLHQIISLNFIIEDLCNHLSHLSFQIFENKDELKTQLIENLNKKIALLLPGHQEMKVNLTEDKKQLNYFPIKSVIHFSAAVRPRIKLLTLKRSNHNVTIAYNFLANQILIKVL